MAFYKVWLTVRDRYGNTKEVEGGNIKVDTEFDALSKETLDLIEGALPFNDYIKRESLDAELEKYATDEEVAREVSQKVTNAVEEKVTVAVQEKVAEVVEEKITETVEEKVTEVVDEKETIRYGELEFRDR